MKKALILSFIVLLCSLNISQAQTDEEAIKAVILNMFDGMRAGDSAMVHNSFGKSVTFQRVRELSDGDSRIVNSNFDDFLKAIGTPHDKVSDEQIRFGTIQIDGSMASVWTPFKFYFGEQFSHCGVNVFKLNKTKEGWKIFHLVDTNRKENCDW